MRIGVLDTNRTFKACTRQANTSQHSPRAQQGKKAQYLIDQQECWKNILAVMGEGLRLRQRCLVCTPAWQAGCLLGGALQGEVAGEIGPRRGDTGGRCAPAVWEPAGGGWMLCRLRGFCHAAVPESEKGPPAQGMSWCGLAAAATMGGGEQGRVSHLSSPM
ncbi:hypothetical protein NDU88_001022 [Pleurodeles waltl]|uniref:Uncharacterized protein n=1 Tax=Pleurodeles waltl TaxID=8319 RepID=A0AAV7P2Y7_PLEWA|nr:hypothetical protein NDU88_001022 [Pleurodeles waltl]